MTTQGGSSGVGVIFKMNADGSNYTVKHSFFSPTAGARPRYTELAEGPNGKLYGITPYGGTYDKGVLFEYDPTTKTYVSKIIFNGSNGQYPHGSLTRASNGKLYGMVSDGATARDMLFEYTAGATTYTVRYTTPGSTALSLSKLTEGPDGKLYGLNPSCVFSFDPVTYTYEKLVDVTGAVHSNLTLASNNIFYGVTENGGPYGNGTIFQFNPLTKEYIKKIDFGTTYGPGGTFVPGLNPAGNVVQAANGKLYGVTDGGGVGFGLVYEYDIPTNKVTPKVIFDPNMGLYGLSGASGGLLLASNGKLYGISVRESGSMGPSIFEYDPATNSFFHKGQSSQTLGNLMQASNGKIYGISNWSLVNTYGGLADRGSIYSFDPVTKEETLEISFEAGPNGLKPTGSLTQAYDGKLYGMTSEGGQYNYGVIFSMNPTTGVFTKILDFGPDNGFSPFGSLTLHPDGNLYGMTSFQGYNRLGQGSVFQFNPSLGQITNLATIDDRSNGREPFGSLALAPNGKLYGMTRIGGTNSVGVILEYNPVTNSITKKIDLQTSTGGMPFGDLTLAPNGKFYGMTSEGGSANLGVLFEYDYVLNQYTKKIDFTSSIGDTPYGSLVVGFEGKLYGTNRSELFAFDPSTGQIGFSTYVGLSDEDGHVQKGRLVTSVNGKLYGMASVMGANKAGTIFAFDPVRMYETEVLEPYINHFFHFDYAKGARPEHTSLMATRQSQSITVANTSITKTYGDADFAVNATSSAGLALSLVSSNPTVAVVKPNNQIALVGAGTATIEVFQVGNSAYLPAARKTITLTVNKAVLQAKADNKSRVFGTMNPTLTITYSNFVGIDNLSSLAQPPTIATTVGETSDVGVYPITLSGGTDENYSFVLTNGTMEITKADQYITFNALQPATMLDESILLPATSSAGLPVAYTSSDHSVAQINGNVVTIRDVGTTTITASQTGNLNYNPATDQMQILSVVKVDQTISFDALSSKQVTDNNFLLSASSSSGLPLTYSSSNSSVATVSGEVVDITGPGIVTIIASQPGNDIYNAAEKTQQLIVTKLSQTISFGSITPKGVFDPDFLLTGSASSGLPLTYSTTDSHVIIINGNVVNIIGTGVAVIKASQAGDGLYDPAADVTQTVIINRVIQTINFPAIENKTMGDLPFALNASSDAGLEITYSTTSDKVSIHNSTVTFQKSGRVAIDALQPGNDSHLAAVTQTRSFCVNPAKPVITMTVDANDGSVSLHSNESTGNQWYKDDMLIAGATEPTFEPTEEAAYSVQVTADDCRSHFSEKISVVITGLVESHHALEVYPNPVEDFVTIYGINDALDHAELIDLAGRRLSISFEYFAGSYRGDLRYLKAGIYTLLLFHSHQVICFKLAKK